MVKKLIKNLFFTIAIFVISLIVSVSACAERWGDYNYIILDDGTVEITGYLTNSGELVIPEEIDGRTVTSIGNSAFINHDKLTGDLIIPSTVTNIGSYAFCGCSSLTGDLVIPKGLKIISRDSFSGCKSLTSLDCSNSVEIIESSAFKGCINLEEVANIDNLSSIESFAFMSCESLKKVNLPATLKSIGLEVFYGTTNLQELTISYKNPYLICENFTIYNREKTILYMCVDKDIVEYKSPDTLETVMPYAFFYCFKLEKAFFGKSVSKLGYLLFMRDTVKSIIIENPYCIIDGGLLLTTQLSGYEKSTTKIFADANGINFKALECNHEFGYGDWIEDKGEIMRECKTCYHIERQNIDIDYNENLEEDKNNGEKTEIDFFSKFIEVIKELFKKIVAFFKK